MSSLGDGLVEALDLGELVGRRRERQFLDGVEAFGDEKAGDDVVDVQRLDEEAGAAAILLLAALAFLGFGEDVDVPAGKLAGEADVLAAAADGKAELLVGNDDLHTAGFLVHDDLGDLGRGQGVDDEGGVPGLDQGMMSIFSPCSSCTTAWTRLPRMPTQAPTGSMELVAGDDGHLGAAARVAGDGLDLDDAVVDLGHFLGEELGKESWVGAADRKIWGPRGSSRTS